jgi:hypothetical protein
MADNRDGQTAYLTAGNIAVKITEDFKDSQEAIIESMTLAFLDPGKRICVLTDASDRFYAGLMT